MKTLRFVLGLCLLIPLFAQAQKNGAPAPEPVRIRFLFLDESDGAYSVKTGETTQDLGTRPYAITGPFEFMPGAKLELLKFLPDATTGIPVRTRILSDKAPSGFTHALAVITPVSAVAADGSLNYKVRFYDVAPEKTPVRSIRILNLSPVPMAARFGDIRVEVAPDAQQIAAPVFDPRNRVRSFIASQAGGSWQMIFNSFLSLPANARMTGIVVYSPSGMIHTYTAEEIEARGRPQPGCFWLSFSDTL